MSPTESTTAQVPADFTDYVRILLSRRRLIAAFTGLACVLAMVMSLLGPQVYRAEVTLLPEESSSGIDLGNLASSPIVMDLVMGGGRRGSQVFVEMLSSRSVMEGVVRRADLIRVFKLEDLPDAAAREEALQRLKNLVTITESNAGIISIKVDQRTGFLSRLEDRRLTAERAAEIANAFAEELNRVNQDKSTSRAHAVRGYLEKQLAETEARLQSASDSLARFQVEHKAVNLEEQTKAAMEGAGELRGRIVAAEVELNLLRRSLRPGNMQLRAAEARLREMRRQYEAVQYGAAPGSSNGIREFLVPFSELPDVGKRLAVLVRDVKIQETVYELLTAQYYQAKIQETRDVPSLSVLDEAVPPVQRHWPKRKLLVLSTALVSCFVSSLVAFGLEYRDRRRALPPRPLTWGEAWSEDRDLIRRMLHLGAARGAR